MRRCAIFLILLILSITFLQSALLLSADAQTTKKPLLKPTFGDSDLPEGPAPGDQTHYKTFTFDLDLPKIANDDYIDMIAELEDVTKYEGSCANYDPGNLLRKEDLFFHKDDYPKKKGGWVYRGWNKLTFSLKSDDKNRKVPTQISVRCYDWGAYGKVTFLFKKRTGFLKWDTLPDDHSIPMDKNKNRIGDGWENDGTKTWKDDIDNEHVPNGNPADGDGWSVYDEYRGLILKKTDKTVTRLDPTAKDVMFCPAAHLKKYGTGDVEPPHHEFHTIEPKYVLNAFDYIWNAKGKVPGDTKEDKGWVNQYSKGERGHHKVPGYAPVWAIRVDTKDGLRFGGKQLGNKQGIAIVGSPSQASLTLVFKDNIEREYAGNNLKDDNKRGIIQRIFIKAQRQDNRIILPNAAEKKAIADAMISKTISHEIGHCLDLEHCAHANCVMNNNVRAEIDWKIQEAPNKIVGTNVYTSNRTLFAKAHDIGYAATKAVGFDIGAVVASPINMPSDPNEEANNEENEEDTDDTPTPENQNPTPALSYTLTSSDGSYTATAGTGHEANFTTNQAYSYVYWYVRSPSGSGLGTNVKTDTGDSSTTKTAQLSYSFPTGVAGDYTITAYVYGSDNSVYQTSYTVSVLLPTTTPAAPAAPAAFTPTFTSDKNRLFIGHLWTGTVTANQDMHGVQLFLKKPSDTSYYGKKTAHFVGGTGVRSIDLKHYFHKHTSVVGTYKVSVRVLEMGKNMWSKHHYLSENVTITSSQ